MKYFLIPFLTVISINISAQSTSGVKGNWELVRITNLKSKSEQAKGKHLTGYKIRITSSKIFYDNLCNACTGRYIMLKTGKLMVEQESCNDLPCGGTNVPYKDIIPYEKLTKYSLEGDVLVMKNTEYALQFKKVGDSNADVGNDAVEEPENIWGVGIISNKSGNGTAKVNFPAGGIKVYSSAGGQVVGDIKYKGGDIGKFDIYHQFELIKQGSKIEFNVYDLKEISFEGECLKYYKVSAGYVQVLTSTINNGVWLKISDLEETGFFTQPWLHFLQNRGVIFFPIKKDVNGLKLMQENVEPSTIMDNMIGKKYKIRLTGANKGNWLEVTLKEYDKNPCDKSSVFVKNQKGWVKALNDKGEPNIWFNTRGCR
ncbi:MAG: hypothetical protein HRT71_02700 [Flavobacteriales bacterium]|nr:hypothetical protein [Flavobacteriales bacterium]